jgi:hypothetical protein
MAKRILATPVTYIPSEGVFSTDGLIMRNDRAWYLPCNASEFMFLHDANLAIHCFFATPSNNYFMVFSETMKIF